MTALERLTNSGEISLGKNLLQRCPTAPSSCKVKNLFGDLEERKNNPPSLENTVVPINLINVAVTPAKDKFDKLASIALKVAIVVVGLSVVALGVSALILGSKLLLIVFLALMAIALIASFVSLCRQASDEKAAESTQVKPQMQATQQNPLDQIKIDKKKFNQLKDRLAEKITEAYNTLAYSFALNSKKATEIMKVIIALGNGSPSEEAINDAKEKYVKVIGEVQDELKDFPDVTKNFAVAFNTFKDDFEQLTKLANTTTTKYKQKLKAYGQKGDVLAVNIEKELYRVTVGHAKAFKTQINLSDEESTNIETILLLLTGKFSFAELGIERLAQVERVQEASEKYEQTAKTLAQYGLQLKNFQEDFKELIDLATDIKNIQKALESEQKKV